MTKTSQPIASDHLIRKQFGTQASAYLTSTVHAAGADLTRLAELLATQTGTVLDLGCGAGHCTYIAAESANRVIAYDLTDEMLSIVEQEAISRGLTNVETQRGTVMELPYESTDIDTVISRFSAHHWPELGVPLAEMKRVLAPGKQAILIDVVAPPVAVADTWLQALELLRDPSHVRDYSVAEWEREAEAAGFSVASVEIVPLRLEFESWVSRMAVPADRIAALKALHAVAPTEARETLNFEADGSMTIPVAVMVFTA